MGGSDACEPIQRREREARAHYQNGRSILTIVVGCRHDVARPTNQVAPGTGKQMADVTAGTKARACRNRRNGQKGRSDNLGGSHPKRTLHTPHCLKEKAQRVSKTAR